MKDITIESIKLNLNNWTIYDAKDEKYNKEKIKIWTNTYGDVLTVNFFKQPPNLPQYVADIHSLRNFYRDIIFDAKGGLVEVEKEPFDAFTLIRSIFKIPQDPTGFTFLASFSLIMESYTFIIKVECPERGMTGTRECAVLLGAEMEGKVPKGTLDGWFTDPYDPSLKNKVCSNLSDQAQYDHFFPEHPLSRARSTLNLIRNNITFGKDMEPSDQYFTDL